MTFKESMPQSVMAAFCAAGFIYAVVLTFIKAGAEFLGVWIFGAIGALFVVSLVRKSKKLPPS